MLGWFKSLFSSVDVIVEQPKVAPQPVEEKPKVDLASMTKVELDIHARSLGLKVDRRRTKDYIIEQIENHTKEN